MKIESLLSGLKSSSKKKRLYALIDLGMMGGKAKTAVPDIENLLNDQDEEIRINAVLALKDIMGKRAEKAILPLLNDPSPKIRACVAATIGLLGNKAFAYPLLQQMLASSSKEERDAANLFVDDLDDFQAELPPNPSEMQALACESRTINCDLHEELRVIVGSVEPPALTEIQEKCIQIIRQLPKRVVTVIRQELVRKFIADGHGNLVDFDGVEDFEVTIQSAVIPALKATQDAYFFLSGQSDYDIEHGFACLFKNGTQFCVCVPELAQENYRLDDAESFERILRSSEVVNL